MTRKVSYRAGLFETQNLGSSDNISCALHEFSGVITEANCVKALDGLLEENNVVELILSGMNDAIPLQKWILDQFPSAPKSFETSFFSKLLLKLSNFFIFQSSAEDADVFKRYHQTVNLAPEIFQSLSAMTFLEATPGASSDRPGASKKFKAKSTQRDRKQAAKAARAPTVNNEPFEVLDLPIPQTSSEREITTVTFMNRLKDILEYFMSRIRAPEMAEIIQASFLQPAELAHASEPVLPAETSPPESPTEIPNAFPMVQPMKSAVYFDSPQDFGEWRILVSSRADRNLREHHKKSKNTFEIIVNKIKDLSKGHFSPDNHKRLSGPNTEVPVFEAKMTSDLRLIYQVDCVADYDSTDEIQVLRIFGIYTHTQMRTGLWDSVAAQLSLQGPEYRKKCLRRNQVDGDVYRPVHFSNRSVIVKEEPSPIIPNVPVDHDNELHRLLTLEKYVTLSQELLDSIEADQDVAFPFEVSVHERTIIQYPRSCYVLGRSGTGKTTTMLFKMLFMERAYLKKDENTRRPRQVFVTQSRVLASKVKELFDSYFTSLDRASAVGTSHTKRGGLEVDEYDLLRNDVDFADLDDDLPLRFSELDDKHFPLFTTVDRLYSMIEADLDQPPKDNLVVYSKEVKGKLVTFDRFSSEYWPHFNQTSTKRLYPSLVFNEIMGVILGSEGVITSPQGHLDRSTYEGLSAKAQPTFAAHRSTIFDIFESYQKMKRNLRDFDGADRTRNILHALAQQPLPGHIFDQLYVDETQDNLIIDAVVLRMLCCNPDGLFWAGDTAQTISNGSSFRFNDLKRVMFQIEAHTNNSRDAGHLKRTIAKEPKMFRLAVNYRSHAGIVNCAHTVVELIQQYWPDSIDILPREQGAVVGAKPVFYRDIYPEFIQEGHFLSRDRNKERIELGADQCILVRNEAARERLMGEIGKIGLILTLYDSKGLEFNDVFIYNFFHDSVVGASHWRMVLRGISNRSTGLLQAVPEFDPTRHAAICAELKSLYVAITRARNNLRIADESLKGESMRALWESRAEIQSCYPGDELSDFAAPSGKEDWEKRATEFFRHERYVLARDCYEKACNQKAAAIANAFYLRQIAIRTPVNRQKDGVSERTTAFRRAAEAFFSCIPGAQDPQTKRGYYRLSAKCLEQASDTVYDLSLAAKRYRQADDFVDAAKLFRQCGLFEDLHDILVNHKEKFAGPDAEILEILQDIARLYFISRKKYSKAHDLFPTFDEEVEFLEEYSFDLAQLDLLLLHGKKSEAANIHLAEGRMSEAIDLFIEDGNLVQAKECILQGLSTHMSFGALNSPNVQVDWDQIRRLLRYLEPLDPEAMSESDLREAEMFKTISSMDFGKLAHLAGDFLATRNINAAVLCLDYHFTDLPTLAGLDVPQISQILHNFWEYVQILQDLAFYIDPAIDERVWKLFAIKPQHGNFSISPGTLLHAHLSSGVSTNEFTLSGAELASSFHQCLQARLLQRVARENETCRAMLNSVRLPCLRHITYRDCQALPCSRSHALPDLSSFRHLLDLHLLQILIYSTVCRMESLEQASSQQRFWIGKIHDIFNPPLYSLGSPCHVQVKEVRFSQAFNVILEWIRNINYDPNYQQSSFLTVVLQSADLAFTFDKKQASTYMYRSGFVSSPMKVPSRYFRGDTHHNALLELLISLNGKGSSSLLMGILFIRHVVDQALFVDINAFVTFIERTCASLIVCSKYQWRKSFHGIVLPRTWLATIVQHFDPVDATQQDATRFWLLLQPLEKLLWAVYFRSPQSEHLLYGRGFANTIANQGIVVRSIYLSRICRCLGLLFCNINVMKFRDEICDIFSSLRRSDHHGFSHLYARYIFAEDHLGVFIATRRSMRGSPLDEMVQLFHEDRLQHPINDILGLRRLVYRKQEDLFELLMGSTSTISELAKVEEHEASPEALISHEEQEVDKADFASEEEFVDAKAEDYIPEVEVPEGVEGGHSEEEIAAALLLQSLARKVLQRKQAMNEPGLDGDIYRSFLQCGQNCRPDMDQGYRLRYLCFVPMLLASLQALPHLLMTKKRELNKKLTSANVMHLELDEVMKSLSHINDTMKAIKRLQKALLPESETHQRGDKEELKKVTEGVLGLCHADLPIQLPHGVRVKLDIVHLGMIQEPPVETVSHRKEKRPELNMEDLFDPGDHGQSLGENSDTQ